MIPHYYKPYFYSSDYTDDKIIKISDTEKIFYNNPSEIRDLRQNYVDSGKKVWESDIKYTTKYIIDKDSYKENRDKILPVRIWFQDIECLVEDNGFPNIQNPKNKINAISFYDGSIESLMNAFGSKECSCGGH